jgi:ABC-type glycerol-3-phosphate transport system substrate-binding protein
MLIRNNPRWIEDMYVEKATGEIVDDAIFERNSMIAEKYNISITYQPSSHDNTETDAVKTILAGDDAYSLVMAHGRAAFAYANQGLVLDWNTDLPYVNLDNPWWDQDARKSLSINNQLYVMIGDLSYCSMGAANLMLFNKQMFMDLDLEFPYQLVKDGKWTYETWETMAKGAAMDLNGDGR